MKVKVTSNQELKAIIRQGLMKNNGYCPCILNSNGKDEYKCLCQDFRINKKVGETCHCGLYIKIEE